MATPLCPAQAEGGEGATDRPYSHSITAGDAEGDSRLSTQLRLRSFNPPRSR